MVFKGWRRTSLIEYPGRVSTVLFTGGCNFRCPFCYNSDLVLRPEALPDINDDEVLSYLRDNRRLYEALVVTGGEPTLHSDLSHFLQKVKSIDLSTGLETNGSRPKVLNSLLASGLVDFIAMDVKSPFVAERYDQATGDGGSMARVLESLEILKTTSVRTEVRITAVPGLMNDSDITHLSRQLDGIQTVVLQQFIPDGALDAETRRLTPYAISQLEKWQIQMSSCVESCLVRHE